MSNPAAEPARTAPPDRVRRTVDDKDDEVPLAPAADPALVGSEDEARAQQQTPAGQTPHREKEAPR